MGQCFDFDMLSYRIVSFRRTKYEFFHIAI